MITINLIRDRRPGMYRSLFAAMCSAAAYLLVAAFMLGAFWLFAVFFLGAFG